MKKIIFVFCLFFWASNFSCFAQGKIIDSSAIANWITLQEPILFSKDSKYILYKSASQQVNQFMTKKYDTTFLISTDKQFKRRFPEGEKIMFSSDSRYAFLQNKRDSLLIVNLANRKEEIVSPVIDYTLSKKGNWLLYQENGPERVLVIRNLNSGKETRIDSVIGYLSGENGENLIIKKQHELIYYNLNNKDEKIISRGLDYTFTILDNEEKNVAFLVKQGSQKQIRYFSQGMDSATVLVTDTIKLFNGKHSLVDGEIRFNENADVLFFQITPIRQSEKREGRTITSSLTIWSYKDKYLKSQQLREAEKGGNISFTAAYNLKNGKIILIESEGNKIEAWGGNEYVLTQRVINHDESYWNGDTAAIYIISLKTGKKTTVYKGADSTIQMPSLSPSEKFVIWLDQEKQCWMSYEIATKIVKNITPDNPFIVESVPGNIMLYIATEIKWLDENKFILADRYDLWKVDLLSHDPPINLTKNFGRTNHISFRYCGIGWGTTILLSAINQHNQETGFWKLNTKGERKLEKCIMDNYLYEIVDFSELKNFFLVRRMNAVDALNLYLTKNFKTFNRITNFHPQKKYNWLTSSLIYWKTDSGDSCKGILYKPQNFDPSKKYPIIFTYYEKRSNELNQFLQPSFYYARINVPWYVSRGYLICVPDMFMVKGHQGESALKTVLSAAKYLGQYSWVDSNRMGLQGHSFGGFETNYIITHTNIFAAAQEAAGNADLISSYGGLVNRQGVSRQQGVEKGQGNFGCPPWVCPELFIENTPIFGIGKVTTPLLMIHNKGDNAVMFSSAMELFTGLRRAGKRVWLLEYEQEDHVLLQPQNQIDATIRMQQFFDHYLKGERAPRWMTEKIDYKDRQIESGLDLDGSVIKP